MKKGKTLIAVAAAAGIAGVAYSFLRKKKIPASAIVDPFNKDKYLANGTK